MPCGLFENDPIPHLFISICSGCIFSALLLPVSPVFLCSHASFGLLCLTFFIDWLLLYFYNLFNLQEFCSALVIFDFPHPGLRYSSPVFASDSASLPPFIGASWMSFLWCVHLIKIFFFLIGIKLSPPFQRWDVAAARSQICGVESGFRPFSFSVCGHCLLARPPISCLVPPTCPLLSAVHSFSEYAVASEQKPAQHSAINNWKGPTWLGTWGGVARLNAGLWGFF